MGFTILDITAGYSYKHSGPHVCFFFNSLINQSICDATCGLFRRSGFGGPVCFLYLWDDRIVSIGVNLLGALSDRIGREITYTLTMICCICGILLLITFPILSSPYIPYLFAIFFVWDTLERQFFHL